MLAQDVPDFGLARLNSVRVGEEEEDLQFRKVLDVGSITEIGDLLQEDSPKNFEVSTVHLVEHNCKSSFFSELSYT